MKLQRWVLQAPVSVRSGCPYPRSDLAQTGPIQSHLDTNFSLLALLSEFISSFSQGSEEVNRPST
jgi:hypothetical protein